MMAMAAAGANTDDFAVLFERITGQSTLVERQRDGPVKRLDDGKSIDVGEAVDSVVRETDFKDVIDDPDPV